MKKSIAVVVCLLAAGTVLGTTPTRALTVEQEAKLLASDGAYGDRFGGSGTLDGDTAVIGAHEDDDNGEDSGSAYVFARSGGVWTEQAKLLPADGAAGDRFGGAVALEDDTAFIGAAGDDDNGERSGSAYVFARSGGVWTEQAKLLPADGSPGDRFGMSIALHGDTVLIGAGSDDDNGEKAGSAYVFTRSGGVWTEQAKLLPADGVAGDYFGTCVALDGYTAVINAPAYDDMEPLGSAYVFTGSGGVWTEQAKLLPPGGAIGDGFGGRVALVNDTALISASWDNDNGDNSGSAYVFTRSGGVWTEQAKLLPADGAAGDHFGHSLALDGDTAIIGAHRDEDNGEASGSAYLFTRSGGVWTEQAKLLPADGGISDIFGVSVALDGDTAVVGAYSDDDNGYNSGSAYVFRLYDDDVPATGGIGSLLLLLAMLGTGVYFVRRRATG